MYNAQRTWKAETSATTTPTIAFLQDVIDASGSNVVILDENRSIVFVNRAWRQFAARTGCLAGEVGLGKTYPDTGVGTVAASAKDAARIKAGVNSVLAKSEIGFQMEYQCTATPERVWFRVRAEGFLLRPEGKFVVMVSHDDITAEKRATESLAEDRQRLGRLWGTTNILPWEADARTWEFTLVGEQAEQLLGYPKEMWFDPDFWPSHIHTDDRERALAECATRSQTDKQYQFEYRMVAKDGRVVWINDIVNVQFENGKPVTLSGFMVDITERKHAENTLKFLGGRLITAQEEERKRIARDLHDDLNQRMALLSIELEQVGQMLGPNKELIAERVKELQQKALGISTEIHRMSYSLHPSKLDHLGLVPALNSFCNELAQSRGVHIDFRHQGFPADLSGDVTLCVFRIAQEALQNAAKHSGAARLNVELIKTNEAVKLTISDRGCGFDMKSDRMNSGLGFISMKERLRLVNGELQIRSKPSHGTAITVSIPLNNHVLRPISPEKR